MVTLGSDSHKSTHTVVAVDANGRQLGSRTVRAISAGHLEALRWAERWPQRRWALEDCRHVSRGLERDLLSAGETVVRVSPKLMAGARQSARELGKSDPIDALAVARAALREPDLPVAHLEGPSREVKLLLDHREDLVAERTRMHNRLRWHLHELEPGYEIAAGSLNSKSVLEAVAALLAAHDSVTAEIARELVGRIAELTVRATELEGRISSLSAELAPSLLALEGCGGLTAAKIVAETADISRFSSRGAYATNNGTAPIPVWSGNHTRFRLNRGGNRQLNAALHRIAITQIRQTGRGRAYLEQRMAAGNTKAEALRALKRRISDEVYRRLWQDHLAASASRAVEAA
ncbi:MAG: IS110 family transposase [Candidatus Dormibacteraeota bacterium]|nr:IS110 family transposase [Candidatus Dormibacteraeota bacterium]